MTSLELESAAVPHLDQVANAVARQFGYVFDEQVLGVARCRICWDGTSGRDGEADRGHWLSTALEAAPIVTVPIEATEDLKPTPAEDTPLRIPKELKQLRRQEDSLWV